MTREAFDRILTRLVHNCAAMPADEQFAAKSIEYWKRLQNISEETFNRGVDWLIEQPDFKWLPVVGELLQAINQSAFEVASRLGRSASAASLGEHWRKYQDDPEYRAQCDREKEEWLNSPEHRELQDVMEQLKKQREGKERDWGFVTFLRENEPKVKK